MYISLDDGDLVLVDLLTLDEALAARARTEAELPWAYNSAHAAALRLTLDHLDEQIEWLHEQAEAQAADDAADQIAQDWFADYLMGI